MKGHYKMGGTSKKIEAHIAKHRAEGGALSGDAKKGDDDAEKDVKSKPARYNNSKVEDEAEEMKAKKGGKIEGGKGMKHAGRKHRASGGGCEANPFTSAAKGTAPAGHKVQSVSE